MRKEQRMKWHFVGSSLFTVLRCALVSLFGGKWFYTLDCLIYVVLPPIKVGNQIFILLWGNLALEDDMSSREQRTAESACNLPGALWWHSFGHERQDNVCSLIEDKISIRTNSELRSKIPLNIPLIWLYICWLKIKTYIQKLGEVSIWGLKAWNLLAWSFLGQCVSLRDLFPGVAAVKPRNLNEQNLELDLCIVLSLNEVYWIKFFPLKC